MTDDDVMMMPLTQMSLARNTHAHPDSAHIAKPGSRGVRTFADG
jgi:hypothetical protein